MAGTRPAMTGGAWHRSLFRSAGVIQSNDPQAASRSRAAALIMTAPCSAIMMVGALVLVDAS